MWTDKWVGMPFRRLGRGPAFDCLGLYLALQKERHGVTIPDPQCALTRAAVARASAQLRPRFERIDSVQEGDAVLFHVVGHRFHVGYALNSREMLHIETNAVGSAIENYTRSPWVGRLEGFYRFVG